MLASILLPVPGFWPVGSFLQGRRMEVFAPLLSLRSSCVLPPLYPSAFSRLALSLACLLPSSLELARLLGLKELSTGFRLFSSFIPSMSF